MTTTYEATQERPNYWDGLRHDRRADDGRNGDWRMSHTRVARECATLEDAEKYARRILGQRPGVPVEITRRERDFYQVTVVARVSRDALGRTWTDILQWEV
jgi:hypothetical protein